MALSTNHNTGSRRPATDNGPAADRGTASGGGKTVLQVLPAMSGQSGLERDTAEVAAALVATGDRAVVASAGGPLLHALTRAGAKHVTLPVDGTGPLTLFANVKRLAEVIRAEKVEIVHARSHGTAASAWWAARRSGCRFVTTFHETYGAGNRLDRRLASFLARGERVIAVSRFIAGHVRRVYGVPDSRLRIVPRGIDFDRFNPSRVTPDRIVALANRWRLTDGFPVVMLAGELAEGKGQTVLVNAIHKLGRRDVRCLLIGSDKVDKAYREGLEALIARQDLGGVVRIIDHCDDMSVAYMLSDVVVSASTAPEAFGRTLIEAQALGRLVIGSDHGGPRETVVPGGTGWLTPPGDADALAAAIDTALTLAPEARERLVAAAAAHVRANYSKETMCRATLAVYDEVQ
jgi:glycosyltransferase involved in cell wall biosynthesis